MTARHGVLLLYLAVSPFGLSGLIGKTVESSASVVSRIRSLSGVLAIAAVIRWRREPTGPQPQFARATLPHAPALPGITFLAAHTWSHPTPPRPVAQTAILLRWPRAATLLDFDFTLTTLRS